mmetsp:Transcript_22083/g.54656  ORF Transcript_22083/g.54656 Transcript_22083/m.54656 type:complete len:382 (+) Transcript_22083:125-1270(+)
MLCHLATEVKPSLFVQALGWALGLLDYAFFLVKALLGKNRPKYFSKGWGDLKSVMEMQTNLLKECEERTSEISSFAGEQIDWEQPTREDAVWIQHGKFISPCAALLPEESRFCMFSVVRPCSPKETNDSEVYIMMLPATGEMGNSTRLIMAKSLAEKYGWSSVIITAPFYGRRRPRTQKLFFVDTVSNLLLQSLAIVQEAASLAIFFLSKSKSSTVCFSGFSWGGAMSSVSSAVALIAGADGSRIACAPYVGSASPVCLVEGVVADAIDWNALRESKDDSYDFLKKELYTELNKTQLSVISERRKKGCNGIAVVRAVCMRNDQVLRLRYVHEFLSQLKTLGSEALDVPVKWIPGGHAIAALLRPSYQQELISEAVLSMKFD